MLGFDLKESSLKIYRTLNLLSTAFVSFICICVIGAGIQLHEWLPVIVPIPFLLFCWFAFYSLHKDSLGLSITMNAITVCLILIDMYRTAAHTTMHSGYMVNPVLQFELIPLIYFVLTAVTGILVFIRNTRQSKTH
jgi:hypothetical protein